MGHQSEIELQTKRQNEVEAERLTRLDKILLSEQQEQGAIDLRPGEEATWLVRENRNLMIGRVRQLERYGLATELEPGRWLVSDRAESMALRDTSAPRRVYRAAFGCSGLDEGLQPSLIDLIERNVQ